MKNRQLRYLIISKYSFSVNILSGPAVCRGDIKPTASE